MEGASPRTLGDLVEHLEALAADLLDGTALAPGPATTAVLETIEHVIRPRLAASGPSEIAALLAGLDGRFIAPGPSGAPSRGRLDVPPHRPQFLLGRYPRRPHAHRLGAGPEIGRKSPAPALPGSRHPAALPRPVGLGHRHMRTGGDDIAQALAFIGARPIWDPSSLRLAGYEITPLAKLGRPRVDVTLRISGFFRDAFPAQIDLFDKAIRAIGALDEPEDQNPIAAACAPMRSP